MDRFWNKVNKIPGGCWEWTAALHKTGYGAFGLEGKVQKAHRVGYTLQNGTIPDGLLVLHKCDNPICVRGDHLFLGTHQDNARDRENKSRGKQAKGSKQGKAKLTERDVRDIREKLKEGAMTHREIASIYGVAHSQVTRINTGKGWTHV